MASLLVVFPLSIPRRFGVEGWFFLADLDETNPGIPCYISLHVCSIHFRGEFWMLQCNKIRKMGAILGTIANAIG